MKTGLGCVKGRPYTYLATHPCRHREDVHHSMGRLMCKIVDGRMTFNVIISQISATLFPIEAEFAMGCVITYQIEPHPNHLDVHLGNGIIGEASGSGVICLDR